MLGCCIRGEPILIDDDSATSTIQLKPNPKPKPSVYKTDRAVVSPIQITDDMIDLEVGLNHQQLGVYEPREMPKTTWTHGIRIGI